MPPKRRQRRTKCKGDTLYVPHRSRSKIQPGDLPVRRSDRKRKASKLLTQYQRLNQEGGSLASFCSSPSPSPKPNTDNNQNTIKRCFFAIATGQSAEQFRGSAQQRQLAIIKREAEEQRAAVVALTPRKKIPRPPNAFMLFANEWRRKLANQYPSESNKDISVRLGRMWKNMEKGFKDKYFSLAREVDAEHKRKYPDYVYNPKEARLRKAMREQNREARNQMMRCQGGAMMPGNIRQPGPWGPPARQPQQRQGLISPRILAEQQRNMEETKKVLRDQVEHSLVPTYGSHTYLDLESMPYHQLNSHMNVGGGEDYVLPDMEGQEWLQYAQTSQPSNTYMMRPNEEVKLEQWNSQFPSEAQMQQAYNMKQQIMNGATHHYANSMPHQQMNMATTGSQQMMNRQIASHNNTSRLQEQNFLFEHPPVTSMANQAQNVEMKKREEPIQMLELMSAAASSNIATPTTSVTPSKIKGTQCESSIQQTPQSKNIKSSPSSKSQTSTSMVPNASENSKGSNETESNNCPLPAFETAFGSTEIGRYSHEGFFNTNQQLEMQQVANTQRQQTKSTSPGAIAVPQDLPTPNAPATVLSPTAKIQLPDSLISPTWSSAYYFSPGIRSQRPNPNISMNGFTCYDSPHFQLPPYAYYDYTWLAEPGYISRGNEGDAVLVSVHPSTGFINGSELHVALDAGGSTVLAAGNTFCDNEGMNYVTLHIPADSVTSNPDPLGIGLDNDDVKTDDQVKPDSFITKPSSATSVVSSNNEEQALKQSNTKKVNEESGVCKGNDNDKDGKKKDDLERQDLITKMAMREPIVISETERICVLMDSPTLVNDGKEFSFL